MKLQDIFQLLSYVVAIVSSVLAWASKRHSDKTMEKIELTKEEFARENEQLKRQQHLDDERSRLFANFFGSINEYQATYKPDLKEKALRACGEVLPVCSDHQKKLVINVRNAIERMVYEPPQEVWDAVNQAISEANINFYKAEEQSK